MDLTDQDFQQAILSEVREAPDSALAETLPVFWEINEVAGRGYKGLQYLFTLRRAINFLLHRLREEHDVMESGISEEYSQIFSHLNQLLEGTDSDIKELKDLLQAGAAPLVGVIECKVVFWPNPAFTWADPNSRLYRGDPEIRRAF